MWKIRNDGLLSSDKIHEEQWRYSNIRLSSIQQYEDAINPNLYETNFIQQSFHDKYKWRIVKKIESMDLTSLNVQWKRKSIIKHYFTKTFSNTKF